MGVVPMARAPAASTSMMVAPAGSDSSETLTIAATAGLATVDGGASSAAAGSVSATAAAGSAGAAGSIADGAAAAAEGSTADGAAGATAAAGSPATVAERATW